MNNFTYRSNEEKDNLEAILKKRKRKFNTQQWVARGIMLAILVSVGLYVANHVYYTQYDGYVHVDENKVRAPFDIFLDSIYVRTGDIIYPGDTLYSYYAINTLVERANPNREPAIVSSNREMQIKRQATAREISVLRVQIAELRKQIAVEDHNISFGLSSNSHRLDLERNLTEAEAKLRALQAEYGMYSRMIGSLPTDILGGGGGGFSMVFDDIRSQMMHAGIAYNICADSSIVTEVKAPDRTILFQKEDIMTTQHLDLEANNLCIIAYVPVDKMHRITNHTKAEVIINGEFTFTATVTALGLRTEEIPENLRSYFAKKNTALIARLQVDPGQTIPFWCLASGLPVDVRVKNADTWKVDTTEKNYLWYITGRGISEGYPGPKEGDETVATKPKPTRKVQRDSIAAATDSIAADSAAMLKPAAQPAPAQTTTRPTAQSAGQPAQAQSAAQPAVESSKPVNSLPNQ